QFYHITNLLEREHGVSDAEYQSALKDGQFRNFLMGHMRNALGYPLAEAWFQQTGLSSEGLDVTADLRVAFFFAMYRFTKGGYAWREPDDQPCVVYRWRLDPQSWTLADLNRFNYYSCPSLIPVEEIFKLLQTCRSLDECVRSLEEYRNAI